MKNGGIRRILQHDVLGEDEGASDAYTILNNALNTIINNFDAQSYSRYVAFPVMNEFSKKVENENGAKFRDGEDKKTASGKRGTADSHNPLSGSLLSGSSERLSGNTLAYPVDAAKVLENTEITKAKVKKNYKRRGFTKRY